MQAGNVMAALIAIICASAPVVQAQTRSPRSYSKVEIDKKIDQIRRDLIAKIPTPEQIEALLGPVYSKTDVDQKLNQLSATIPQPTVSRQDLDKALQQTVSRQDFDKALEQTVSRQDLNEAIAGATDSAKAREKAIDDKLPWMPAWVAPLVSFLGVTISGGLAYYIASNAREQAKTLAAAARADAEADATNIRTNAYIREWRSGQGRMHALVLHDLTCAQAITDPDALNRIADVGNWLDDLADDTLEGRLDQAKINPGFRLMAEEFRNALAGRMEDDLVMRRNAWTRLTAWI
jgi:cell division septum initiation protein DivIVA